MPRSFTYLAGWIALAAVPARGAAAPATPAESPAPPAAAAPAESPAPPAATAPAENPPPPAAAPLYREAYRPQFHFSPKANWLNDPNGLVYYKGEYHLFFQHNPQGLQWGNMTWGHAVSRDLVHWEQLPNAIEPDKYGTIFSGSAAVDWNNTSGLKKGDEAPILAMYTAAGGTSPDSKGQRFTQRLAFSNDCGRVFQKCEEAAIKHIVKENRDPRLFWHEPSKRWVVALFLDKHEFAIFNSEDLKTFTETSRLTLPESNECPDLFPLPLDGEAGKRKWIFLGGNGHYLVGDFDGKAFTRQSGPHRCDFGANFYAAQTFNDLPREDGRRIQIAWMAGGNFPGMPFNGQMSFPCALELRTTPDGPRLVRLPVKEIESLYVKRNVGSNKELKPGENLLAGLRGELWDIRAEIEPGEAEEVGFKVRGHAVSWIAKEKKLYALGSFAEVAPVAGKLVLRMLVDRSSLEVFAGGGAVSMTSCFLPKPDQQGLEIYCKGSAVKVVSLEAVELKSAWPAPPPAKAAAEQAEPGAGT